MVKYRQNFLGFRGNFLLRFTFVRVLSGSFADLGVVWVCVAMACAPDSNRNGGYSENNFKKNAKSRP